MRINLAIYSIIFFFITQTLLSQSILKGFVYDKLSDQPLPTVNIYTHNNIGTSADFDGNYILELPPGEHTITYNYIGYNYA